MLEMEPYRSLGEDWCINKPNVATPQRRDALNVATLRERLNKPYLLEKL